MLSRNEWDPLKHVIVGRADNARIPSMDRSLRTINYSHLSDVSEVPQGLYPPQVIEEANQDLEIMVDQLIKLGIRVSRPERDPQPGYYHYCPRDSVIVLADMIIETPMPLRSRAQETEAMHAIFADLEPQFDWIQLRARRRDELYNMDCVDDPDVLALAESEASFDAANVIRANDDIFYLVSNSGNHKGAELLQRLVGPQRRVWPITGIYSYMHIDSTIALLREGLMLLNPSRIKSLDQLPPPLRSWDVIWATDPGDTWHYPGYCNSSRWHTMNILSVNPSLVIMEPGQDQQARDLARHGIDTVFLPMRHSRTLGGSFHCVSLDLERQHS